MTIFCFFNQLILIYNYIDIDNNSGTPSTDIEYAECKEFLNLFDMVTDVNGILPFEQMNGEQVICANMKKCADGSRN